MRRPPVGGVVDHSLSPIPITLQGVIHDAESLQSICQPTETATPACRPLTVGPSTYKSSTATRLSPSTRDGSSGCPVRAPDSLHAHHDHCGEAVPCPTCALEAKEPAGPCRTSNDHSPGKGSAPGLISSRDEPTDGTPRHNHPCQVLIGLGSDHCKGSLPHADPDREQHNRNGPAWQRATFSGSRVGYTACIDSANEVLHQPSTVPLVRACPELSGVNRPATHSCAPPTTFKLLPEGCPPVPHPRQFRPAPP